MIEENYIKLAPVSDDNRPLWTVVIPTHNCAHFLREALKSVLQQDPGKEIMEIIVVDDYSTLDKPEDVVNEFEAGRITFVKQKKNVGKVRNYETGLQLSKGKYIHQLHGDDLVLHGFYKKMEELFNQFPDAHVAFCRTIYISENGIWRGISSIEQDKDGVIQNWLPKIAVSNRLQTSSIVLKRHVYETIGTFDRRLDSFEDWEMWIRVAANNISFAYSPSVLSKYRTHNRNTSSELMFFGTQISELRIFYDVANQNINATDLKQIRKKQKEATARYLIDQIGFIKKNKPQLLRKYVFEILKNSLRPKVLFHLCRALII